MGLTRRQILGAGIAAVAGAAARRTSAAVVPTETKVGAGGKIGPALKLSCCAYSVRDYLPRDNKKGRINLHDFIELGAAWGLDGVELTSYYFDSEDKAYLHALKAKAFRYGLDISGTAVGNRFAFAPGKERDEQIATVKRWVDNSVILGSPCMRIFAGGRSANAAEREQAFRWVVECAKECSDYAGQRGVFLAMETHGHLTETAEDVLKLVEAVNNPWLGINLDIGNLQRDPYGGIAVAAPKTITTHIKVSVYGADGKTREDADYGRIVRALREANYRGYLSLEYEAKEDQMVGVPKQLRRIREAMNQSS